MQDKSAGIVPFFKTMPVENISESKTQGRPIFKDVEMVEIRIAGERNYAPTFPAHEVWRIVDGVPITYAERFSDAYARFKASQPQVAEGTPVSELPFLTEAKRSELRALKIYTAEALADLEGANLKALGVGGRELKTQAEAYLAKAKGSARDVALAAEVEALRAELAALRNGAPAPAQEAVDAPDDEKEALKAKIADLTGQRPRGNPSVETLKEMLSELTAGEAA